MNNTERDTHFNSFAFELFDELMQTEGVAIDTINDQWREEWEKTIARRAYDLVVHALKEIEIGGNPYTYYDTPEEIITNRIPDMLELPEVKE